MLVAALFSGGKDSAFAAFAAGQAGHSVECLVSVRPKSDESRLLHRPNIEFTALQAESMRIPLLAPEADDVDPGREARLIRDALGEAKRDFGIGGVVHGGILSEFQRRVFDADCCRPLGLAPIAPLWGVDQGLHMRRLVRSGFAFILTSVTAGGLDGSWLGRRMTGRDIDVLESLSERHSFNLSFEGGEAETFVVDCPLFSRPISIKRAEKTWDGYRGRFEIREAELGNHA